jgi:hypothetical protein
MVDLEDAPFSEDGGKFVGAEKPRERSPVVGEGSCFDY